VNRILQEYCKKEEEKEGKEEKEAAEEEENDDISRSKSVKNQLPSITLSIVATNLFIVTSLWSYCKYFIHTINFKKITFLIVSYSQTTFELWHGSYGS
jgi:hypothetical protein